MQSRLTCTTESSLAESPPANWHWDSKNQKIGRKEELSSNKRFPAKLSTENNISTAQTNTKPSKKNLQGDSKLHAFWFYSGWLTEATLLACKILRSCLRFIVGPTYGQHINTPSQIHKNQKINLQGDFKLHTHRP